MFGREGGSWDMQNAVPLGLIFFLAQAKRDRFQPIGEGEAVCLLSQASLHSGLALMRNLNGVNQRKIHFQLFESVCRLAKSISCYDLQLTLNGSFWVEIEQALLSNMIYNQKTAEI